MGKDSVVSRATLYMVIVGMVFLGVPIGKIILGFGLCMVVSLISELIICLIRDL